MFNQNHFNTILLLPILLLLVACGGGGSDSDKTDVDVSTFDGVWYSPCFNNTHGFSARQKITINSTSLISDITTYAQGATPALNCAGDKIDSDITVQMAYGSTASNNFGCTNNKGVETNITLSKVETSGITITNQSDMNNSITLLTSNRDDFLPDSTTICLKPNGNLFFAGQEYTGNKANSNIVESSIGVTVPDTKVTWKVGSYAYTAGPNGSSSIIKPENKFGVLTVNTTGLALKNGDYSGSNITISHALKGAGIYTIIPRSRLAEVVGASSKLMVIDVIVGGLAKPGSATGYNATAGTATAVIDKRGNYHFTISSAVQIKKTISVGGGVVPNPPEMFDFTMTNIYDYSK